MGRDSIREKLFVPNLFISKSMKGIYSLNRTKGSCAHVSMSLYDNRILSEFDDKLFNHGWKFLRYYVSTRKSLRKNILTMVEIFYSNDYCTVISWTTENETVRYKIGNFDNGNSVVKMGDFDVVSSSFYPFSMFFFGFWQRRCRC